MPSGVVSRPSRPPPDDVASAGVRAPVVLGVVLILCAIVNVVRAFNLRAFGGNIWIAVLVVAVLVGVGGVLIVVNPWGASMMFVLVLGAVFIVNGAVDLFIEWYVRDSEKKNGPLAPR